jgi:hypothetical protein
MRKLEQIKSKFYYKNAKNLTIERGFLLAQKIFQGKFKIIIKKSESWLAESKHHKPPTPDIPVQYRLSRNRFSLNRRFKGSVPNLGGTGGLVLRREAYGWIRWNDVYSCEVVG